MHLALVLPPSNINLQLHSSSPKGLIEYTLRVKTSANMVSLPSLPTPSSIKARISPHLHLEVPKNPGSYGNERWSNPDLDPVPPEKRTWGAGDYWAYWTSDMLAPPLASTVSVVMSLGFTGKSTLPIVFFGFMICSVVITLTGKIGAKYSIPYPVVVRGIFGMYGSMPAILLRGFVALMWTAILCVQAADFLRNCITAIWPSFADFPNTLPDSVGIDSAGMLCFFLYWIFQTILSLMPIHKLRILFLIKAIIVPPTFLALFLWGAIVTKGGGPLVTGPTDIQSDYMNTAYSALVGLNVMIGLFSSMAVNMPDFGRFSKNNLAGYNQYFALPVIGTLGALTPIFVTAAHEQQHGEFQWYMPAIIAKFDSRAAKFFVGASFILATIGNQIAAGTFPFSNDVSGLAPKYINIFRATLMAGVFCVVCQPWLIIKNAAGLLAFLSGYSCMMGPLAGVIVCDYWIIKKQRFDIREMYKGDGIYYYSYGINWRAWTSFFVGFLPTLPGFAKSIDNTLNVGGAWKIYTFAWLFGFSVSMLVHYVINMYISPHRPTLLDAPVLPPQIGEVVASDEEATVEKSSAVYGEKELEK